MTCLDCNGPISTQSRTGRCRSCVVTYLNAQPWFQERRMAAVRKLDHNRSCGGCGKGIGAKNKTGFCLPCFNRDPECKKRRGRGVSIWRRVKFQTDPVFARSMREHGRKLAQSGKGNASIPAGSEPRLRAGRKVSLAMRAKAERRAERARLAEMSPFERQMEALKRGAGLVEKRAIPSSGYGYTLGGVTEL